MTFVKGYANRQTVIANVKLLIVVELQLTSAFVNVERTAKNTCTIFE